MRNKTFTVLFVAGSLFAATVAQADHNSILGAGHANMPNDIHNSAIEDDHEVFLDLVQQGADLVNRYDDTTTVTSTTNRSNRPDVSERRTVDRSATDTRAASRSMARSTTTAARAGGGSRR